MKIILDSDDFIQALTPFYNGCSFIAYVDPDDIKIGYGCYCLVNLVTGAQKAMSDRIRYSEEGEHSKFSVKEFCVTVDDYYKIREAILSISDKCTHCHGTVLVKSQQMDEKVRK